jgi:hypothetical protein
MVSLQTLCFICCMLYPLLARREQISARKKKGVLNPHLQPGTHKHPNSGCYLTMPFQVEPPATLI